VWRSNFGSTAIALVAHFLASNPSDDTEATDPTIIQETCNDLLDKLSFLYEDLDYEKLENTYRSQFVIQLLAHTHMRSCVGCPDIPRLDTDALKAHGIRGALSLCCAAVSTAFLPIRWHGNEGF